VLCRTGARAGVQFPVRDGATRVGRAPDNDAVIDGPDAATVSLYHCEIVREGDAFRVVDHNSTNGTWVNGERVTDGPLDRTGVLRLGQEGPEFSLLLPEAAAVPLDRTIEVSASTVATAASGIGMHEDMLSAAVHRARTLRARGVGGETMTIMREVLESALQRTYRRHRILTYAMLSALLVVSGVAIWKIVGLSRDKRSIDARIRQLDAELQKAKEGAERDELASQVSELQEQGETIQRSLLYRFGTRETEDFVTRELRAVMAELGAEVYSIPPEFIERVNHYVEYDCGPERPNVEHALVDNAGLVKTIRRILEESQMPPDLAYIPIVESAFAKDTESGAGAAGPWQMTAVTARAYGLRVDGTVDERKNLVKSTGASCRYLKDLILEFGTGSSVMLALAAYNSGASKVRQAVTRTVRDPIKQRNFWYLYRTRALPLETREYVPKVFAAILIGRNQRHFGF
jgi:hypothetical protein